MNSSRAICKLLVHFRFHLFQTVGSENGFHFSKNLSEMIGHAQAGSQVQKKAGTQAPRRRRCSLQLFRKDSYLIGNLRTATHKLIPPGAGASLACWTLSGLRTLPSTGRRSSSFAAWLAASFVPDRAAMELHIPPPPPASPWMANSKRHWPWLAQTYEERLRLFCSDSHKVERTSELQKALASL